MRVNIFVTSLYVPLLVCNLGLYYFLLMLFIFIYSLYEQRTFSFSFFAFICNIFYSIATPIVFDLGIVFAYTGNNPTRIFNAQKDFVSRLLNSFTISRDKTLIGIMQYGRESMIRYEIGSILTKRQVDQYLATLSISPNTSPGTNLLAALQDASANLFDSAYGSREGVMKSLLVFNNKKTGIDLDNYDDVLKSLRKQGVKITVVSIGDEVDKEELNRFASHSSSYFHVNDLPGLEFVIDPVAAQLLPGLRLWVFLLVTCFYGFSC